MCIYTPCFLYTEGTYLCGLSPCSPPHTHTEALKAMEKVASHINDMQKLYEDYGAVFDQLVAEQTGHNKEVEGA